jgi:TPR repeat protein
MAGAALRRLLALALLGMSAAAPAGDLSAELAAGQAALAAGDYPAAYRAYLDHGQSNPLAQFTLGLFHEYGWGRPVDRPAACRWQERAAPGGIPAAQQALADCLRQGVHRPADPTAAAHWYEQAARSGILLARCSLAELYMAGEGVARDPRQALALCRQAAEQGLPAAQLRLARFLLEGDVSVRDPAAALHWMRGAAQANNAEAQYRLGLMLRDGVGAAADAGAARWWLESASAQGWLPAYLPTAELYLHGRADSATGALPAAELAKAYLWSAAAVRRGPDQPTTAQALLAQVVELMPPTWQADLDRRVSEHLDRLGATVR